MRIKKLMNDSFYVNNEAFSGVTSVSALTSDFYFHYYKGVDLWKLSGNTFATASGPILENSSTVTITATIESTGGGAGTYATSLTGVTGTTYYWTRVVNEDGTNVKSECTFDGYSSIVTLNASKNVRLNTTGTTTINVTHPDVVAVSTIPVYIFYPGDVNINAGTGPMGTFVGATGTTYQASATTDPGGFDVTTDCSWTSSVPSVATVGLHTGLITFLTTGYTEISRTYPTGAGGNLSRGCYSYWPMGAIQTLPLNYTGTTTGQTVQLSAYTEYGYDITSECTFEASGAGSTGVITVSSSGLVTFVGNAYSGDACYITTTHTNSGTVGSTLGWAFIP